MAATDRAIRTRVPLVDLVLEVRDARIPASSAFEPLRRRSLEPDSRRRVVVLNKADLADPSEIEKWVAYMKQRSCPCIAVNSHNRESTKEVGVVDAFIGKKYQRKKGAKGQSSPAESG